MSIAIFASGNGSNFQTLVECSQKNRWERKISLLFCDKENAPVLTRARQLGVPSCVLLRSSFQSKQAFELEILQLLLRYQVEWIVLAGYMKMIGPTLLEAFPNRIVNIHPSLLPAFPGKDAIEQAFDYPVKVSGVTVHYVDAGMDTGPIIAQFPVFLTEEDTIGTFAEKIHQVEHDLYPKVVQELVTIESKMATS